MDVLEDFLHHISGCLRLSDKDQSARLAIVLSVNPRVNGFAARINNLGPLNRDQVIQAIERRKWHNEDWPAFDIVVNSLINLFNQLNPWSVLESFDLYSTYLNDVFVAFANKTKGHLLSSLFKETVEIVLPMAKQLDMQMLLKELHRKLRLTYVAAVLLKGFNHIRSLLGANDHIEAAKKRIMLFLGGKLCLIYFTLSNPLLCQNVFANMNNANFHISAFPKNEQMFYRYYLAKFYMMKYQFIDAYEHLFWCLRNTPLNHRKDNKNTTLILRDFIPVSIILGKLPNLTTILMMYYSSASTTPEFFLLYSNLLTAIKRGSLFDLHQILNDQRNIRFLKKNNLIMIVSSKSFILTLRNLLRRVWVLGGKVNRLHYDQVAVGLRVSLNNMDISTITSLDVGPSTQIQEEETMFYLNVENCLVSLIDQNLLKGKVFPRLRVVSLAKSEVFPAVDKIYFLKFGNGSEGSLSYMDKWMA